MAKKPKTTRSRSAISGRLVTAAYAKAHPKTCVVETVKNTKKK